jgi:hypothetical protein
MKSRFSALFIPLLVAWIDLAHGAERFRTDINPALLYYQAYALAPDLPETDRQYLFNSPSGFLPGDTRSDELLARYENMFKMLRRARFSEVPCDWGVDLTQGPETLLPALAKSKNAAQAARLRVRWHLQHGRQVEAREDLLAAFALGRNVSKDGVLISALVQLAMESIAANAVAENFFLFTPETLQQIVAGFDESPPRGTIQDSVQVERTSFHQWFVDRIHDLQAEGGGNEAKVLSEIRICLLAPLPRESLIRRRRIR